MPRSRMAAQAGEREDEGPRYSGRLLLRMTAELHAELADLARREGVSLNQFITGVLADAAARRRRGQPDDAVRPSRAVRYALAANFVVLALAAALAVALLVVALRG